MMVGACVVVGMDTELATEVRQDFKGLETLLRDNQCVAVSQASMAAEVLAVVESMFADESTASARLSMEMGMAADALGAVIKATNAADHFALSAG